MKLRSWLAAGSVAGLVALGASGDASAQTTKLRFQASFPASSYNYKNFEFWANRVKVMSGGRLEIEVAPAGTLVPAFEVLDAVHKQVIDGGHTAAAYWVGKHRAAALFGPAPGGPFGMDIVDIMGWMYEGGGLELWKELYQVELKRNVVPIPLTAVNNQVLGWFAKPVKSWEDLKGKKLCGTTGAFYNKDVAQKYGPEIASFDGSEKPLLALKNNDCIGYLYDQTFIAGKLTDDDWKGGYHMPLTGIMETPWAIAVKLGEANLQKFMEDVHKDWLKSGRIVELEKKWGVPPTDYAKRMHEKAKSGS